MMKNETMIEVFIPRSAANRDPHFFVAVNGERYPLPRRTSSPVPAAVAAEIERARAAEDAMYEAQEALKTAAE